MTTVSRTDALLALIRFDKPIGTLLLLWPTLWALWLAAGGLPDIDLLLIFAAGTFLMRSAGCIVNDYADRDLDGGVTRTRERPLVTGAVSEREAIALCVVLLLLAFILVLQTNPLTVWLSVAALLLASTYPFMKRFTHLPQVVLGAAFSWGIPMAFAAQSEALPPALWLLYAGNLFWTVAYDTQYAMVDRSDDLQVGIKSSAILFGRHDRLVIGVLQTASLLCLAGAGHAFDLGPTYYASLLVAGALFIYHQMLIRQRDPARCFAAFRHNNYVGMVVFLGVALDFLVSGAAG